MDYNEKLAMIELIRDRLKILEVKIKQERTKAGKCPHDELMEVSTFVDRKEGRRVYMCKMCGARLSRKALDTSNVRKVDGS